uniref:Uncharacterized protein n=1 Tax=Micrurus carvalhoi TaxID=3147026 RepID=A0A2H6NF33_9SAUR
MWECISSTCNLLEVPKEFVTEPFFIQRASYSGVKICWKRNIWLGESGTESANKYVFGLCKGQQDRVSILIYSSSRQESYGIETEKLKCLECGRKKRKLKLGQFKVLPDSLQLLF